MASRSILSNCKKILSNKITIVFTLLIILTISLYHNNQFYDFFKGSINGKARSILKIDILHESNKIANLLDVIGGIKKIQNPLTENDYLEIKIDSDQEEKFESYLKENPINKKWVKIKIKINGVFQKAKLKSHGTVIEHHMIDKYSCTIKLDKDSTYYIKNFKRFKLIKGEQVNPTVIAINQLANKLGLISSYGEMKMVKINGIDKGHYYLVEDIKEEFLERERGITNYALITNVKDWTRKDSRDPHSSENDLYFGHIEKRKNPLHPLALNQYKILAEHVHNNNIAEIKKKFDIEYIGKYLALASIFNDIHFIAGDNLKLIYDFDKGKFFPIYRAEYGGRTVGIYGDPYPTGRTFVSYNKFLFHSMAGTYFKAPTNKIFKLLLSDNEVRNIRDKCLYNFTKNKDILINHINNVYRKNEKIMLRCESRRNYNFEKRNQLSVLNTTLNLSNQYLTYGHIYGSYDSTINKIDLLIDAFSPINIYNKNLALENKPVNGIEFDPELNIIYNYQSIKTSPNLFDPNNTVFVNSLTKDTIDKKHIYINFINTTDTFNPPKTIPL